MHRAFKTVYTSIFVSLVLKSCIKDTWDLHEIQTNELDDSDGNFVWRPILPNKVRLKKTSICSA